MLLDHTCQQSICNLLVLRTAGVPCFHRDLQPLYQCRAQYLFDLLHLAIESEADALVKDVLSAVVSKDWWPRRLYVLKNLHGLVKQTLEGSLAYGSANGALGPALISCLLYLSKRISGSTGRNFYDWVYLGRPRACPYCSTLGRLNVSASLCAKRPFHPTEIFLDLVISRLKLL